MQFRRGGLQKFRHSLFTQHLHLQTIVRKPLLHLLYRVIALENESKRPGIDNLINLVRLLNIPDDAIFYPEQLKPDDADKQLFRMIQRLNSRDKEVIKAAIQKMLEQQ